MPKSSPQPAANPFSPAGHIADVVSHVNGLKLADAIAFVAGLDSRTLAALLEHTDLRCGAALAASVADAGRAEVLESVAEDRMADLLCRFTPDERQRALQLLGPASRTSIMRLMAYPEGTAGSIMTTEFVQVPQDWTVARTLEHIRATEHEHETVYAIYAVDGRQHLQFVVSLRELVCAGSQLALTSLRRRPAIACGPYADREEVARIIRRHNFLALPVVGEDQRMVGIVSFGSSIGAMLPFVLQRLGLDPASASAPLVATLVDVLGLVIYFSAAALLLGGTLL